MLIDGWSAEHEFGAVERRLEAERLLERSDQTLLHDAKLAAVNEPVYFHEFAAHAARHGLQYLAEADFFEIQTGALPEAGVAEQLIGVDDPLVREQYLDFLKGRRFRQTLLCQAGLALDRSPRPLLVMPLAVSSSARSSGSDRSGRTTSQGPTGGTLATDHPLVIRALEGVGESWPGAVWIRDLVPEHAGDDDQRAVCDALLRCYAGGLVQLHMRPPHLITDVSERPEASPLARHQAESGHLVTNLRHQVVKIEDALGRRLVTLLDGSRDLDDIGERAPRVSTRGRSSRSPTTSRTASHAAPEGLAGLALLRS